MRLMKCRIIIRAPFALLLLLLLLLLLTRSTKEEEVKAKIIRVHRSGISLSVVSRWRWVIWLFKVRNCACQMCGCALIHDDRIFRFCPPKRKKFAFDFHWVRRRRYTLFPSLKGKQGGVHQYCRTSNVRRPMPCAHAPPFRDELACVSRTSWTMNPDDLDAKAARSGAKFLLLSHMRGKVRPFGQC